MVLIIQKLFLSNLETVSNLEILTLTLFLNVVLRVKTMHIY